MAETREARRSILHSAVEQFLDHLEDEYSEDDDLLGAVLIAGEINTFIGEDGTTIPSFWCSNENAIWQRGFFECLADYKTLPATDYGD